MQNFLDAYLECALWSSCDMDTEEPLDNDFDVDDFAPEAIEQAKADCEDFQAANEADLALYAEELDEANAGHDFWLTRNGHGAGFWARGMGEVGDRLTEMSKPYGEAYIYHHDGRLYFS